MRGDTVKWTAYYIKEGSSEPTTRQSNPRNVRPLQVRPFCQHDKRTMRVDSLLRWLRTYDVGGQLIYKEVAPNLFTNATRRQVQTNKENIQSKKCATFTGRPLCQHDKKDRGSGQLIEVAPNLRREWTAYL